MNKRGFLRLLCGGGALALGTAVSGCVVPYAGPYPRPVAGPAYAYDHYYYPDVNVYYALATGFYFYRLNRRWRRTRRLPRRYNLRPRYRRPIAIGSPVPYRLNRRHRRVYRLPPAERRLAGRPPRGARARGVIRRENRRERTRLTREWRRRRGRGRR